MTTRSLHKIVKKNKRQRIDDIVPTETYKTDDRVDAHDDHDSCVEHDQFVEADFECGLDSDKMGNLTVMTLMTVNLRRKLVLTTKICSIH